MVMLISAHNSSTDKPLRILAVAETWYGANSDSFVRAFRRTGHSVSVIAEEWFVAAGWRSAGMRAVRRLLVPMIVREFNDALVHELNGLRPHLLFVFKGFMVTPESVNAIHDRGGVAINVWPDVSFTVHGRHVPRALPLYDWVFTTKTFGMRDMEHALGIRSASFLPPAFDAETHRPVALDAEDRSLYECDVSFVGTWSPKKDRILRSLRRINPNLNIKIWGEQWTPARSFLGDWLRHRGVTGTEYSKAICASKINIAILSEARSGSSSGDLITTRTFEIPACGGFMLHERNDEVRGYFEEGKECAMFGDVDELVVKIAYYLKHGNERRRISEAGYQRCVTSGYSVEDRVATVIHKARELRAVRPLNQNNSNIPRLFSGQE
jgi:spore maturation protein CgeB